MGQEVLNRPHLDGQLTESCSHYTLPLEMESMAKIRFLKGFLRLMVAVVALLITTAALTPIRDVVRANGQVIPEGSIQLVQHEEGGRVLDILVRSGDYVEKGQLILRFEEASTASDFGQLEARLVNAQLRRQRLQALLSEQKTFISQAPAGFDILYDEQKRLLEAEKALESQELATLEFRIQQREEELQSLMLSIASLKEQLKVVTEQYEIRAELQAKGYVSKQALLDTNVRLLQTRSELETAQSQLEGTRKSLNEAQSLLSEFENRTAQERQQRLAEAAAEIRETEEALKKQEARFNQLGVRAPVSGIVQNIAPSGVGAVVRPGDVVAQIVPTDDTMVVEAKVFPEDVGHIKLADTVYLKISTYDPDLDGILIGEVTSISPSTFQQEDGTYYYRAIISVVKDAENLRPLTKPLVPGMTVVSEIITGEKTLLRYLLAPIANAMDVAFTEQ
jgi:adhesin transport system membrane fusion protein